MPRRPAPTDEARAQAVELANRAADLTRTVDYHEAERVAAARDRAALWREAWALGLSAREIAAVSGLHPSQVEKALRRDAATGRTP